MLTSEEIEAQSAQGIDFVIYIDTDSCFLNITEFLTVHGVIDVFEAMTHEEKLEYVKRLAVCFQEYVNDKSYEVTQLQDFNSQCHNHKISFKSELICSSGLWVRKKKYMLWVEFEDGYKPKENLKVTGLDTIRSNTPSAVKPMIKEVMTKILTSNNEKEILEYITEKTQELYDASPEMISENIAVHNLWEYMDKDFNCKKATPRHAKGCAAYLRIIKANALEGKADNIGNDEKVKVVYLKKNPECIDTISFIRWLPEFDDLGLQIDYDKMIENNFTSKLEPILAAAGIVMVKTDNTDLLREWLDF